MVIRGASDCLSHTHQTFKAYTTGRAKCPAARYDQVLELAQNHVDNNKAGLFGLDKLGISVIHDSQQVKNSYERKANEIREQIKEDPNHKLFKDLPTELANASQEEKIEYLSKKRALGELRLDGINRWFSAIWSIQSLASVAPALLGFFTQPEARGTYAKDALMGLAQTFIFPLMNNLGPQGQVIANIMSLCGFRFLDSALTPLFDVLNQKPRQNYNSPLQMKGGLTTAGLAA